MTALWLGILALVLLLFASLTYLHRLDEVHHGFFGIGLVLASLIVVEPLGHLLFFWLGAVLLVDDDVQHVWEALCLLLHRRIPADFTPIHRLGAWVLGELYALVGHQP